jgi:diguanylate cyclase (GGDEF)-like protein
MKILIADDDPLYRRLIKKSLLKWEYEVIECGDGTEAWKKIKAKNAPNLLILDWVMPGIDGVDICRRVRELDRDSYTYILLVTSKNKKEDIILGMEAGADDYINKPFYPHELKVRLRAGRRIVQMNTELVKARNSLHKMATVDALTGIWNRRMILDALKVEMDRSIRKKIPLSVALMDIDFFKRVNDTYGHLAGDQVLCETVNRVRSKLRSYDSIGRYGGEEFLIFFQDCSMDNAWKQAERILSFVSKKPMNTSEGIIPVTISIGICVLNKGKKIDMEPLIKLTDEALYRAKKNGRNRVEITIFEP